MKPEDTNRHIQQLLEEIDSIPSMDWNEARVWHKIQFKLVFTWLLKLLPILLTLSMITAYIFWPEEKQQPVSTSKKISEVVTPIKKIDSTKKSIQKKYSFKAKHKKKKRFESNVSIIKSYALKRTRTHLLKAWKPRSPYHQTYQRKNMNLYSLNISNSKPTINLRMPVFHIVNMDVNNSFNSKNLMRSLESNDNSYTYYRYKYNSVYLPDPFNNNLNQQQPGYHPQIIQYP